ncbi:MAG: hypothetical protein JWN57_1953 [Frankiales bacterium]|jgi:hypothetical protein|nr:hypothetical protein [Frankiales bacterium]
MTTTTVPGSAAEAQRRLDLALRALHGPAARDAWSSACHEAGVLSSGALAAGELRRVADVLLARGGTTAVAAGSCRLLLSLAGPGAAPTRT